jgi:hypothetical protein
MQKEDRQLLWAAVIAVFTLGVSISISPPVPVQEQNNRPSKSETDKSASNDFAWLYSANFWEAFATCLIAGLAFYEIRANRRSEERQTRAYVDIQKTEIEFVDVPDENNVIVGKLIRTKVFLKNFGQTPAKELTTWAAGQYRIGNANPSIVIPTELSAPRSVPPGGEWSHRVDVGITIPQFDALGIGADSFFVRGELRYVDAFGGSQETDYLLVVGGEPRLRGGSSMGRARTGNRAT